MKPPRDNSYTLSFVTVIIKISLDESEIKKIDIIESCCAKFNYYLWAWKNGQKIREESFFLLKEFPVYLKNN